MLEARIIKNRRHCAVNIDLRCREGELVALTGSSGTGKTTIIRILAGLERPDGGRIAFNGTTWFDEQGKCFLPARKRRVGYVFQEHTLFPHLTVAGNVGFSCRDKRRVKELLSMLGISHLAERMPHKVSGGERQRAALAQALASDPQVLLLDEPFSALDHATRVRLQYEIKRLKSSLSIPIVFVTHDRNEASFLGDSHLVLSAGENHPDRVKSLEESLFRLPGFRQTGPCASHPL